MEIFVPFYSIAVFTVLVILECQQKRKKHQEREDGSDCRKKEQESKIVRFFLRIFERISSLLFPDKHAVLARPEQKQERNQRVSLAPNQHLDVKKRESDVPPLVSIPSSLGDSSSASATTARSSSSSSLLDLSGSFELEKKINFQEFLAAQGVGWMLRKAADKAPAVNRISHVGDTLRIQVSGILPTSETTYIVNGPEVETKIQHRVFRDRVTYLESGDGVRVTKVNDEEGYRISITRRLSPDRQIMTLTSRAIFDDERKDVESIQIFRRIKGV